LGGLFATLPGYSLSATLSHHSRLCYHDAALLRALQLILCKDNASEGNASLLADCRVQLVLCKDNASEGNASLLADCRVRLILCKDKAK
jgi:hypothetical protein